MTVFYDDGSVRIRSMIYEDAKVIFDTRSSYGWYSLMDTYETYYSEQESKKRLVFIAEYEGVMAGYCTLLLNSSEGPWGGMGYPEINDLLVFIPVRKKGIGNKLMDIVEQEASKISGMLYLAVGVHSGYGPAQRMYVSRGYNFDGSGVWYQGKQLGQYEPCVNDDDLLLFMSRKLL